MSRKKLMLDGYLEAKLPVYSEADSEPFQRRGLLARKALHEHPFYVALSSINSYYF